MSALRERGETPDVHSYQTRENLGLGIAKHREFRGEALDGAVSLAELHAGQRCRQGRLGFDRMGGSNKTIPAQSLRQRHGPGGDIVAGGLHFRSVPALHVRKSLFGVLADSVLTG